MTVAVVICGGAQSPALNRIEEFTQGYEELKVIGADRGASRLVQAGYELDEAVGDFDSVSQAELAVIQARSKHFRQYPSEKDATDMELALTLAFEHAPEGDYYVFGALGEKGGRLDHLMSNLWLVHQPQFCTFFERVNFIEAHSDTRFYTAGQHIIKNTQTKYLSIIAMTPTRDLTIQAAKYELPTTSFAYPRAFISNEFMETDVQLSFTEGIVLVMCVDEATGENTE